MLPVVYHPIYSDFPIPDGHRYPLSKYRLLNEYLADNLWPVSVYTPSAIDTSALKEIHAAEYVDTLLSGSIPLVKMRRIGFPWSNILVTRSLTSLGGTTLTVDLAIEHGVAIHLTGGYHHAHYDFGSGFCLFNDLVLAANHALKFENIDKVLIVDCDVHHGDGTASLTANRADIITLSVHCEKNFPSRKPDSNIDFPLPIDTDSENYLNAFLPCLRLALAQHQPDMVIYDAGVDIHHADELGYLSVCKMAFRKEILPFLKLAVPTKFLLPL